MLPQQALRRQGDSGTAALTTIEKIRRLLALQEKVERNSQAVARLKTVWSFAAACIVLVVAAGIALLATVLKDWPFGQK